MSDQCWVVDCSSETEMKSSCFGEAEEPGAVLSLGLSPAAENPAQRVQAPSLVFIRAVNVLNMF